MTKVRGQTEAKAQENQQITSESLTRTRSQTQRSITLCSHRTEVAPPEKLKKGQNGLIGAKMGQIGGYLRIKEEIVIAHLGQRWSNLG